VINMETKESKQVEVMSMDELAAHLMNITKGSRYKISKLTLEIREKR